MKYVCGQWDICEYMQSKMESQSSVARDDVRPFGQVAGGRKRRLMVTVKMTHYAWWMDQKQPLLRMSISRPSGFRNQTAELVDSWKTAQNDLYIEKKKSYLLTFSVATCRCLRPRNEQMFYHKNHENLLQERPTTDSIGSMTPISGGYQRRSIGPLRLAVFFFSFLGNKDHLDPTSQEMQ